jgi:predicted Zn finger-like uncharacterized protein
VKFLCEQCKAKYQIADEKAAGKTVRMKCRKCGHLIEVRAGLVDASTGSQPPPARASHLPPAPMAPRPPQHAPPRTASLATSLASAKPAAPRPSDKPATALAGALKSALSRDDEISAPVDMSDLSPADEWYVAINGVPVGPIRIAEVRRKAAIGAVTEESLCWQEGLDEWRPLRAFPDLAAIVREAFTSGRSSMTPAPPEARVSIQPPQARASVRPASPAGVPPRAPPARPAPVATPPPPAARSNVVPITSRLATAEKLAEDADDMTRPFTGPPITPDSPFIPSVIPDPFAPPQRPAPTAVAPAPAAAAAMAPFVSPAAQAAPYAPAHSPSLSLAPAQPQQKKGLPWMAIAMVVAAAAFGITTAIAVFMRPTAPPAPVVVQVPGAPAPVVPTSTAAATAPTGTDVPEVPSGAPARPAKGPVAVMAGPKTPPAATAPPAQGPLDLHGIAQGSNVAPSEDSNGGGESAPRTPGQCISSGQVQTVIGLHRAGLTRACWERSSSQKPSANVIVSLTIGADGSAQGVSASGDDTVVANCIANDVRGWKFPAMGCSQPTSIPFHFVRQ